MMNFSNVLILPSLKVHQLEEDVARKSANKTKYTNVERSDAFESLGIAQFYNGNYADAITNLEAAIAPRYIKVKSKKRVAMIKTLLGSLYYRFGDLQRAELLFSTAGEACRKTHNEKLWSITLSNLAIVQLRQENTKDAQKNAKAAVELVKKIYTRKCAEYLQAIRVEICIYLKMEEYSRAEGLIEENEFSLREKAVVLAGIHFAQSEYAAAQAVLLRCIEQESIIPTQQLPSSPVRHTIVKNNPAPVAAVPEAYNPWSTNTSSSTTATHSDSSAAKAAVSLVQPSATYMDDLNNEMLGTMIKYNLSILKTKNVFDLGISDTIGKLERFNKQLMERRSLVLTKAARLQTINKQYENGVGPMPQDDPYLRLHCDQHPQYMPFDAYMYPSVTLSTMLTAQSEFDLLTAVFGAGMAIESGHILGDVTGLEVTLRQIQQEFKNALTALQFSLPSAVDARSGASTLNHLKTWAEDSFLPNTGRASTPGTARASAPSTARDSARGSVPNTSRQEAQANSEAYKLLPAVQLNAESIKQYEEIPDIVQAKYNIQEFQILTDLVSKQLGSNELANAALTRLREEHHVFVHPESGKLFTGREIEALLHPKPAIRTAVNQKGGKKAASTEAVTNTSSTATSDVLKFDEDGQEIALDEQTLKSNAEAAAAEALTALATVTFQAGKLHGGTLQSDILPLTQPFGKDQATLWIEWALSKAGALSFGFLSQSCMDPLPDVGFDLIRHRSAPPTPGPDGTRGPDEFLMQVRSRLLDLETVLSTPNENSKLTARGVRLEARVIVFILLCKITVQLDLKKEAGQCVLQLEDVCASLRKQQCDSLDSLVYHTFAMRFRMDYEEWCVSPTASDAWVVAHLVHKVLPVTKQYVALCKLTGDIFLQRDALKRLINVYSEVGGIELSEGSDVALIPKEKIAKMTNAELETNEHNVEWVQRNGSSRALLLYEEMHKLAGNVPI